MSETNEISLYDPDFQKKLAETQELLRLDAMKRRRTKTAKGIKKSREGGEGKKYTYVDRPEYQKWLDENFPGWSIVSGTRREWTERAESTTVDSAGVRSTNSAPILFNVSFDLQVIEKSGIKRIIPCIGSAPVSQKEYRGNTTLLTHKYDTAYTNAYKHGCGWLGAFFDIRQDEEAVERSLQEPSETQKTEFDTLLKKVPIEHQSVTKQAWETQNLTSAPAFLKSLKDKLDKVK